MDFIKKEWLQYRTYATLQKKHDTVCPRKKWSMSVDLEGKYTNMDHFFRGHPVYICFFKKFGWEDVLQLKLCLFYVSFSFFSCFVSALKSSDPVLTEADRIGLQMHLWDRLELTLPEPGDAGKDCSVETKDALSTF